jgi:predicted Zn-dependent protease with MMP-like domain
MEASPTADPAFKRDGAFADDDAAAARAPDYYGILGLQPDVDAEEIHRAYRRLAKMWHPDRYATAPAELRARAERRMAAINRAYALLGDPLARHVYDRDQRQVTEPWAWTASTRSAQSHRKGRAMYSMSWNTPAYHPLSPPPTSLGNPNGAAEFFGVLCLLLVFCICGWIQRYGLGSLLMAGVSLSALLGIAMLAAMLFESKSRPAQLARHWAEGEPQGIHSHQHHQPGSVGNPSRHGAKPGAPPCAAEAGKSEADDLEVQERARFERLVDESLATIPPDFAPYMENIVVQVRDEPTAEELKRMHIVRGGELLGLYEGVPLTHQHGQGAPPEVITIYRRPIERVCRNRSARIRAQVRATVLHELAHHFGIDHDEMPSWVK